MGLIHFLVSFLLFLCLSLLYKKTTVVSVNFVSTHFLKVFIRSKSFLVEFAVHLFKKHIVYLFEVVSLSNYDCPGIHYANVADLKFIKICLLLAPSSRIKGMCYHPKTSGFFLFSLNFFFYIPTPVLPPSPPPVPPSSLLPIPNLLLRGEKRSNDFLRESMWSGIQT